MLVDQSQAVKIDASGLVLVLLGFSEITAVFQVDYHHQQCGHRIKNLPLSIKTILSPQS